MPFPSVPWYRTRPESPTTMAPWNGLSPASRNIVPAYAPVSATVMTAIAWPANPETRPCQAPANVWVLGMATGGWRDAQLQSSTTPTSIRPRARRVTRAGARVRREAPGKEPIDTRRPQEADVTPLVECDRAVPACGPAAR